MNETDLITIFLKNEQFKGGIDLTKELNMSDTELKEKIDDINEQTQNYDFQIIQKAEKFILQIDDYENFNQYLIENNLNILKQTERSKIILFHLFQSEGYITIETLTNIIEVSRNTIVNDLKAVEDFLEKFYLILRRKKHYGVKICGNEKWYRKAFAHFIHYNNFEILPSSDYVTFIKQDYRKLIEKNLLHIITENNLSMNDVAYYNLVQHIEILLFRTMKQNYITNETTIRQHEEKYFHVAEQIVDWMEKQFRLELPDAEVSLLSAHIQGKTATSELEGKKQEELAGEIEIILSKMDQEFSTSFSKDEELKWNLVLHVYPLLKRLYHNMELANPLIEEIYSKYANVFLYSYRFSELITQRYQKQLSRDEVGYISLHFATYLEREKRERLNKYKHITIICSTGAGSANLIRLKLENIFPYADIELTSLNQVSSSYVTQPDLFISTIPIQEEIEGVPVLHVKEFLDENEVERIKNTLSMMDELNIITAPRSPISKLFIREFFYRIDTDDYVQLLREMAEDVTKAGYAEDDYPDSVIEREFMFPTIYKNAVAGPHSKKFCAYKESVSVAILDKPVKYQNKEVQVIFLINLQKGHPFLHKEISKFILSVIEDSEIRNQLLKCQDYDEFIRIIAE